MPMYKLIEYSDNYSKTSEIYQYCEDLPAVNNNCEIVDFALNNVNGSFNF